MSAGESRRPGLVRDLLPVLLVGLVVFHILRTHVLERYVVPSGSMEPTLHGAERGGDIVVVDKTAWWRPGAPPLRPFGLVLHHDGRWSHEGQPILPVGVPVDPNAPMPTGQGGGALPDDALSALDTIELRDQALSSDGAQHVHRLGIGLAHKFMVENAWGMSYDKPASHMRAYLDVLRAKTQEAIAKEKPNDNLKSYATPTILEHDGLLGGDPLDRRPAHAGTYVAVRRLHRGGVRRLRLAAFLRAARPGADRGDVQHRDDRQAGGERAQHGLDHRLRPFELRRDPLERREYQRRVDRRHQSAGQQNENHPSPQPAKLREKAPALVEAEAT